MFKRSPWQTHVEVDDVVASLGEHLVVENETKNVRNEKLHDRNARNYFKAVSTAFATVSPRKSYPLALKCTSFGFCTSVRWGEIAV